MVSGGSVIFGACVVAGIVLVKRIQNKHIVRQKAMQKTAKQKASGHVGLRGPLLL
jgi:hypothetical protein